jgi:hypothetical protein
MFYETTYNIGVVKNILSKGDKINMRERERERERER